MCSNPVREYHEASKHHLDRYAPGPSSLDWANQPEPFRRFGGAPSIELPLLKTDLPARWADLFGDPTRTTPRTLDRQNIAHLLQLALGVSAWKSVGNNRWALRCNPSSGNLHPTEAYLICSELPELAMGVYHYAPRDHLLEQRATVEQAKQMQCQDGFFIALSGIHWREAWKYGLRAYRYCQHDCGHALAALSYAAAALGWRVQQQSDWSDQQIAALSGLDRPADFRMAESESPETLVWVTPSDKVGIAPGAAVVLETLKNATWTGQANRLSETQLDWPEIDKISASIEKPETTSPLQHVPRSLPAPLARSREPATALIQRRRSAQAFDGATALDSRQFYRMLDALLPRPNAPPWSLYKAPAEVHPVLFVHRVTGLEPGIYCLPRTTDAFSSLREQFRSDWLWQKVEGCPSHIPLYLLAPLDVKQFAATVSCHQDIASDSAFSLAMLARLDDTCREQPWLYRQRFWEAGILGQVLYLEAEAADVQGTGIGCYFDDAVHQTLGLDTPDYQDLYHFTVGTAVVDQRIGSEPAYQHLDDRQ